jgi:hypothetical protein
MTAGRTEVHVSPAGSPFGDGSRDYPARSIEAGLRLVARLREPGQRAVLWLHAGVFRIDRTLDLGPEDSHLTIAAWPGDEVAVEGAVRVTGWQADTIGGVPVWTAPAPEHAGRSLYVAGERRERPRHPREGWLRIERQDGLDLSADLLATLFDGSDRFGYAAGDLPDLADPTGAEVVVPHFWIQERMPVAEVDRGTRTVRSGYRSMLALRDGDRAEHARYAVEGVVERLGEVPGEWYADRRGVVATGRFPAGAGLPRLLYVPRPDEDRETFEAVVPVVGQLVRMTGTAEHPVRDVRLEGITLRYADWELPPAARPPFQMREDPLLPDVDHASDPQAASSVPAAVDLHATRDVALVDCTVAHVGGYGVRLGAGVRGTLVSGCTVEDTGAGGIACGGDAAAGSPLATTDNEISDCEVRAGGRTYPHAVAVLVRHAARTVVAHNHVHDHFSTGVAVGWRWDYGASPSVDNRVEGNHLHDLGQGRLDWFGAIYTLGVSPGTVLRRNLVHDVRAARFGGWGLLLDPATSHVVVEQNVVRDVSSECLHVKTGRENTVRGNVLARGGTGLVSLAVAEPHLAATLTGNLLLTSGTPAFSGAPGSLPAAETAGGTPDHETGLASDLNTLWDVAAGADAVLAGDGEVGPDGTWRTTSRADDAWRDAGRDRHSRTTDPGLRAAPTDAAPTGPASTGPASTGPASAEPARTDPAPTDPTAPGPTPRRLVVTDPELRRTLGPAADGLPDAGPRPVHRRRHPARTRTLPYDPTEDGSL